MAAQVQLELPQAGQGAWQRFLEVHYTVSGALFLLPPTCLRRLHSSALRWGTGAVRPARVLPAC